MRGNTNSKPGEGIHVSLAEKKTMCYMSVHATAFCYYNNSLILYYSQFKDKVSR